MRGRALRTLSTIVATLLLATFLTACTNTPAAQVIAYGTQTCARCGHVIVDPRFAAQYRGAENGVRAFDDPGCLFAALREETGAEAIYFRDFQTDSWISADDLYLVHLPAVRTPQGHGWVAQSSFTAAQDAVTSAGSGEVMRFAEARDKLP